MRKNYTKFCDECGNGVTKGTYNYCVTYFYGKVLCFKCQDKDRRKRVKPEYKNLFE